MMFAYMSRASFLFRLWRRMFYLSAPGSWNRRYELTFDNDCDRQLLLLFPEVNLICYDGLFLFGRELCFDLVWDWRAA